MIIHVHICIRYVCHTVREVVSIVRTPLRCAKPSTATTARPSMSRPRWRSARGGVSTCMLAWLGVGVGLGLGLGLGLGVGVGVRGYSLCTTKSE